MAVFRRRWWLALSVLGAASFCLSAAEITKDTLETVKKNVAEKKALLVDVREKSEWDRGHIEGSVFLPLSALKRGIPAEQLEKALPKDKILYTFCVVGKRAADAGNILEQFGYEVRPLKPGYKELIQAGFKKGEKRQQNTIADGGSILASAARPNLPRFRHARLKDIRRGRRR